MCAKNFPAMHVQYLNTFIFGCPGAPQFLFAPNAQVEQMWSQAKYILSQQRSRMSPRLFETILYLKINDRFWDNNTVQEAISMAAAQDASDRRRKREPEELEQEDLHL